MEFATRLRKEGYRLTPQRQLIIETLHEIGGHATVSHIYEKVQHKSSAIDRATVYRTVHLFQKIGIVATADIAGQTMYEITGAEPHHHLVCRNCKQVITFADHHFHELAEHLLAEHNFRPNINHITIEGTCGYCFEQQKV